MADTLHTISWISFAAAGLLFALAVVLFFLLKIPSVLGDLTGRTAKKSIERMRETNEKTADKSYDFGRGNIQRKKIIESTNKNEKKEMYLDSNGTVPLSGNTTEMLLDENKTVFLTDLPIDNHAKEDAGVSLVMLEDVMLIHTEEVI